MSILISPTEPKKLHDLGKVSWTPETKGCDIMVLSGKKQVGVQRKKFPEDFLGSIADGRLYLQLNQMQALDQRMVLLEGFGKWTNDGELITDSTYFRRFTTHNLQALIFSIMFVHGVPVIQTRDMAHTIEVLGTLEDWLGKEKHDSLRRRQGPKPNAWGQVGSHGWASHLLQGFPGIGPGTADKIVDKFEGVPMTWTVTMDELMSVDGVGKKTAQTLIDGLEGHVVPEKKLEAPNA